MNMTPELTNLIFSLAGVCIGGFISLASALIVAALANHNQSKRDKQNRVWQLEDIQKERRQAIFLQRSKDAEKYIHTMYNSLEEFNKNLIKILLKGVSEESLQHLRKSADLAMKATELQSYIIYLNDSVLTKLSNEFRQLNVEVGTFGSSMIDKPLKDEREALNYIVDLGSKASSIKASMLKRIDELYASL